MYRSQHRNKEQKRWLREKNQELFPYKIFAYMGNLRPSAKQTIHPLAGKQPVDKLVTLQTLVGWTCLVTNVVFLASYVIHYNNN